MKAIPRLAAAAFFVSGLAAPAVAAPVNDLRALRGYIEACMQGVAGEPGAELTLAFSLKRDGSLFGTPHVTYSRLPSDMGERARLLDDVAGKFTTCFPAPITDGLGGAIAGRRLIMRFVPPRREI